MTPHTPSSQLEKMSVCGEALEDKPGVGMIPAILPAPSPVPVRPAPSMAWEPAVCAPVPLIPLLTVLLGWIRPATDMAVETMDSATNL